MRFAWRQGNTALAMCQPYLTHWGRVTHICVGKLTIIGSDNGLSPGRRQAIIWTNTEILLIGPLGTNFSEILMVIQTFWFKKMHLKMSSAKWRPFCLGLNVLIVIPWFKLNVLRSEVVSSTETGHMVSLGFQHHKQNWIRSLIAKAFVLHSR